MRKTGASHVLLHEEDPYWINVNNHLHFFRDGKRFLWGSERDGFLHLYLYGMDGKLERQVTRGEWQVEKVLQVDEAQGVVYYQSTEASPLESQFYSISLDGSQQTAPDHGKGFPLDSSESWIGLLDRLLFQPHGSSPHRALSGAGRLRK